MSYNSYSFNTTPYNSLGGDLPISVTISEGLVVISYQDEISSLVLAEILTAGSAIVSVMGTNIFETLGVSETFQNTADQYLSFIEAIETSDAVRIAFPVVVNNPITLDDTLGVILTKLSIALESINLEDTSVTRAEYNKTLVDLLTLTTLLNLNNFAEALSEGLDIADQIESLHKLFSTAIEALAVSDTESNYVKLLVIASEDITLEDLLNSTSEYSNTLEEDVTFILVLDDGEMVFKGYSYTPETFSVTEYTNYPFNSFAYIDNNYLAASSEGLYLLEGTLDENEFITARIKTASMDLETSNVKQVPQVYLGIDSDANLILTVSVDGKYTAQYELAIDSEDLSTQMFKIGKGLQGRYWQFTLETKENSNFDLDELEIFPITFGRKR